MISSNVMEDFKNYVNTVYRNVAIMTETNDEFTVVFKNKKDYESFNISLYQSYKVNKCLGKW